MKTTFVLTCFLITLLASLEAKLIRALPEEAQGYLVMEAGENPQVASWYVEILQVREGPTGKPEEVLVEEFHVDEVNYLRIPDQYLRAPDHLVRVSGLSHNNEIIDSEGPLGISDTGTPFELKCKWKCNGPTYAWEVRLSTNPTNSAMILGIYSTYDYYDSGLSVGVPYYQYMSPAQFSAFCSSGDYSSYNLSSCAVDGLKIITLSGVTGSDGIKNSTGATLTGLVYGVKKFLGAWQGSFIQTPELTGGDENCGMPINWAISTMNTYGDFDGRPSLACSGSSGSGGGGPGSGGLATNVLIDCGFQLVTYDLDDGDIYDFVDFVTGKDDGDDDGGGIHWPPYLDSISIAPLDFDGGQNVITEDTLFDRRGRFIGPDFQHDPGLYTVGLLYEDKSYLPLVYEIREPLESHYELANFLDVSIGQAGRPGRQQTTLQLRSGATLKVLYLGVDHRGRALIRRKISLRQGQERTLRLPPVRRLQNIAVHRFEFPDGSTLEIDAKHGNR